MWKLICEMGGNMLVKFLYAYDIKNNVGEIVLQVSRDKLTQLFLLSTFFFAEKIATPTIPKTIGRNKNIPLTIVVVIYFFLFKII